jgi:anti-anti-sigma factor
MMTSPVSLEWVEVEGTGPVLWLTGPIDPQSASELQLVLAERARQGRDRVVIDCGGVPFLSDTGHDVLEASARSLSARGGGVTLVGVNEHVQVVLRMLNLASAFTEVRAEPLVAVDRAPSVRSPCPAPTGVRGDEERATLDPRTPAARALDQAASFEWVDVEGAGPVLRLSGPIDRDRASDLQQVLAERARGGHDQVVIDCAGVPYLNDAALDVLEPHARALAARGGGVTLVGVSEKIQVVLEMLNVASAFKEVRGDPLVPMNHAGHRLSLKRVPGGEAGVELLQASGELDERTGRAELDPLRLAARRGALDVSIDCAGLRSLRGEGLSHLARFARAVAELGGSVTLLALPPAIQDALAPEDAERGFSIASTDRPSAVPTG